MSDLRKNVEKLAEDHPTLRKALSGVLGKQAAIFGKSSQFAHLDVQILNDYEVFMIATGDLGKDAQANWPEDMAGKLIDGLVRLYGFVKGEYQTTLVQGSTRAEHAELVVKGGKMVVSAHMELKLAEAPAGGMRDFLAIPCKTYFKTVKFV